MMFDDGPMDPEQSPVPQINDPADFFQPQGDLGQVEYLIPEDLLLGLYRIGATNSASLLLLLQERFLVLHTLCLDQPFPTQR